MKTFELLNQELKKEPQGVWAPHYFRARGIEKALAEKTCITRAHGIYSLFTEPTPVILKNEWITGNLHLMWTEAEKFFLDHSKGVCRNFPERSFGTNKDHFAPNYRHLLSVGLPGLIDEIDASMVKHKDDAEKYDTLTAMRLTLCGLKKMIENYADKAKECKGDPAYDNNKLDFIINNCNAIANGKPQSFAEGLQLVWFCHNAFLMEERYAMAFGRIDQYLYPLYKADVEKGAITDDEVTELLENIFIKLVDDVVNICIGGQNVNGECEVNQLSRCVLKAVGNCNVPGPNLSLRYTLDTPDDFLDDCLKTIGTGLGYPALMNDNVNLAALKRFGYADEDVYDYCMVGCIENFISGKQPPWSDGRFDTPRFFDYMFNHGISSTNYSIGLDTGDISDITSMEEFMAVLEKQIAHGVAEYCASFNRHNNSINQKFYSEPFLSCFCHDCIGRGLDINDGGALYPSVHGAAVMGIGTTADSLAAIEKVIFIDKAATLDELKDALNSNFEGHDKLRSLLLAAPKYGNNDDFVDKYAVWFIDFLASEFDKYKTRDGGGIYIAAAANTSNIGAGSEINATPDGRLRGEPLSDAASPTYGRDTRGATSTVNSVTKPDYTKVACGTVVNQKFSPSMFEDGKRKKLLALIKSYFRKGGQEMQINATSREVLMDAMDHPENYQNLVVRVSGFSAFYVTLDKEVQLDILNRTQQE